MDNKEHSDFGLSPQLLNVLDGMAQGHTQKAVAAELHISKKTVGGYVGKIYDRMDVGSNVEAVRMGLENDMVNPERENLRIVKMSREAVNRHDPHCIEFWDEKDYVWESIGLRTIIHGREAALRQLQDYWYSAPDLYFSYEYMKAVTKDMVLSVWRATGTHEREFDGILAKNRKFEIRGCSLDIVRDGKIVGTHSFWNVEELKAQLI